MNNLLLVKVDRLDNELHAYENDRHVTKCDVKSSKVRTTGQTVQVLYDGWGRVTKTNVTCVDCRVALDRSTPDWDAMTVKELRTVLKNRGTKAPRKAKKADLVRLVSG